MLLQGYVIKKNLEEAHESFLRNGFRQAGNRFLGFLKGLQILALDISDRLKSPDMWLNTK
jgi:hypothetical protein